MSKKKIVYIKKSDVIRYAEWEGAYKALMYISQLPAEDVRPVKHGRWLPSEACITIDCQVCSECRSNISMDRFYYDYCPICGARMDLKEAEKNEKIKKRV